MARHVILIHTPTDRVRFWCHWRLARQCPSMPGNTCCRLKELAGKPPVAHSHRATSFGVCIRRPVLMGRSVLFILLLLLLGAGGGCANDQKVHAVAEGAQTQLKP